MNPHGQIHSKFSANLMHVPLFAQPNSLHKSTSAHPYSTDDAVKKIPRPRVSDGGW